MLPGAPAVRPRSLPERGGFCTLAVLLSSAAALLVLLSPLSVTPRASRRDGQITSVDFVSPLHCPAHRVGKGRGFVPLFSSVPPAICSPAGAGVCSRQWGVVKPPCGCRAAGEELLPGQAAERPLLCPCSLQLFHSVDFEIESSIDLQINVKLSE